MERPGQRQGATVRAVFPETVARSMTLHGVARLCEEFGELLTLDMHRCRESGEVFVTFSEVASAQRFVESSQDIVKQLCDRTGSLDARPDDAGATDYLTLLAPMPAQIPRPFCAEATSTEHLLLFEAGRVAAGKDARTTVCLCGLPTSFTADGFMQIMKSFGLVTKLRFLYLPADAPGYAFMDFEAPLDVLCFYNCLPSFCEAAGEMWSDRVYLVYSQIQGRGALLDYFGGSDAMFLPDANKRPQFFFPAEEG